MSVESQDRRLAQPLELEGTPKEEVHRRSKTVYTREFLLSCAELDDYKQFPTGFDPSVFRQSKIAYTREFLLSCAELDVCKQLPKGFDSSVLHELEDGLKGILEPWKGSGILFLPNSGYTSCRVQFTGLDSSGSSWESVGRPDYVSLRWSRDSNSQGYCHSDSKRHDDLTQCLVEVSGCKAKDMGKRIPETEKNDYFQLSKSENPYRPPHAYQDGRTKYKRKSLSKETIATEKTDSGIQEETRLEGHRIAEGEQHEIKDSTFLAEDISNGPVYYVKPLCHDFHFLEPIVTSDNEIIQFDSKKANMSPIVEDLNEEQSKMILKEDVASSSNVPSGCSSTVIEKAVPQPLAANSECEMGLSGKTCFPITEDSCSMLKNSSEGDTLYFHMNQSHEPISEMEFNELLSNRAFYSGQRGSFNRITRDEVSEPYEFPFTIAYDLFSSVLREQNPIRTNHQSIITVDAADEIDLYDMEENECTFDDMWSEILEILHFEQEMELASAAESDQTADSLISIDNPTSSEHSTFVPLNSSNDVAHYDAEIHLPDENSLITIDDLIAPEDRLISIDYPTSAELSKFVPLNSSGDTSDYDAEIHLPAEDSLITIHDLISPNHLRFIASGGPATNDTRMSDVRGEVARQPGTLVITDPDPAKGSATQGLEVPPSLDVTASMAHHELHFWQSSLQNPCNGINPDTSVYYPFNSLEAQMRLQTTFMDPVPVRCYPALHWYSCPNMVHQFPRNTASPKLKEFSYPLVQYSLLQHPTSFPQQSHLPTKDVASSNLELEKKQLFPLRHQQTAYPDLAIANSAMFLDPLGAEGFDHQMGFNKFIDGRAGKPERALL